MSRSRRNELPFNVFDHPRTAHYSGRVKLLQENPDEYFRRFPMPRFGHGPPQRLDPLEGLLRRAISEILDAATDETTLGPDAYAKILAARLRE